MKRDKQLMIRLRCELPVMPDAVSERLNSTLSDLCMQESQSKGFPIRKLLRAVAALTVLLILLLPNINANIAHAMHELPLIGSFFKVITIRQYTSDDGFHHEQIKIPEISTPGEAGTMINADIKELTDTAIARYKEECESLSDSHFGLIIDYDVVINSADWFTLRIMIFRDAGSGSVMYKYYHIDKQSDQSPTLSMLFRDDFDYISAISQNVSEQMRRFNTTQETPVYWIDKTDIPELNFSRIGAEQNFYFNEEGELVIVFDKYQIAPGYIGCPEFAIPEEIYAAGLR